jgi:excisionase family DNA binding protein
VRADKCRQRKHRNRKLLPLCDGAHEPGEPPVIPLLLTVAAAAFQLSCSERHIYELEASGSLDFCKLGPKATRVTSASVMRLLAQRARPSGHVPGLRQFADAKKEPETQD